MDKRELVAGLIIRGNRLLLVHNIKHNGLRYEPAGGKRHDDEGREEAVCREIREETGLSVKVNGFFGLYATDSPEGRFDVYMYLCEAEFGEPVVMEPHLIGGLGWYTYNEIEAMAASGSLVPNMAAALARLRALLKGDS